LASETVASAFAIPELMVACKAIGAKLFPLDIDRRSPTVICRKRGHIRTRCFFFKHRSQLTLRTTLVLKFFRNSVFRIVSLDWTWRKLADRKLSTALRARCFGGATVKKVSSSSHVGISTFQFSILMPENFKDVKLP